MRRFRYYARRPPLSSDWSFASPSLSPLAASRAYSIQPAVKHIFDCNGHGLRQWFAVAEELAQRGYRINTRRKWLLKGWMIWEKPE